MNDEKSILDAIGGMTASDNILIGATIGGLICWLYWYYKKVDTGRWVYVDSARKRITLGAIPSALIGFFAGSFVGLEVQKRGFDVQSSALIAGMVGIAAPWGVYMLANNSYEMVSRLLASKYFKDVMPAQSIIYSPDQRRGMQGKILAAGEGPALSAEEWDINRRVVLASLAKMQQAGRITSQEIIGIHNLLPHPYDVAHMESQALVLEQRQVELTVSERLDLHKLVLQYRKQADDQQDVIQKQRELLKRHESRYDPQSRIIRDAAFGTAGFLFRTLFGWL